jgi:hypothetical protein
VAADAKRLLRLDEVGQRLNLSTSQVYRLVQVSSSLRPDPLRRDEDELFVPEFVPTAFPKAHSWLPCDLVATAANPPEPPEIIGLF